MNQQIPDLSDEADDALTALVDVDGGNFVTSGRQDVSNLLISTGPDVLWTPRGGGRVAVAYSVVADMESSIRLSTNVRNNGNYDFQLNSRTTDIVGHEPGTLKGVVISGYKKYSHALMGADYLFSDGFANVSHRDPAWMNHPDPGPTEPQREMSDQYIATVSDTNRSPNGLTFDPSPMGPPQSFAPGPRPPGGFSPTLPGEQQQLNTLMNGVNRLLHSQRRVGRAPSRSKHPANARGQTNVCHVLSGPSAASFDNISPHLMRDLMQRYNLTPAQAAGFAGNLGYESTGYTAAHEGSPESGAGGIGYAQWTGMKGKGRAKAFIAFIKKETGRNPTNEDLLNYKLNRGFMFSELDPGGNFHHVINNLRKINSGNSQSDVDAAVRVVWGEYETPRDYSDGTATSLLNRQCLGQRGLDDFNTSQFAPH